MAARRLLIVLLVLLGLSTLAAALIPQRTLRQGTGQTVTSPTQTQATIPTTTPNGTEWLLKFTIADKKTSVLTCQAGGPTDQCQRSQVSARSIPLIKCHPQAIKRNKCEPIRVGDQLSVVVDSTVATELEIPTFGLVGIAAPNAPANFNLIPSAPGTFGILCPTTGGPSPKVPGRCATTSGGNATETRVIASVDVRPANR